MEAVVADHELLLDVLREKLALTGTKRGCDMGTCGCCAVLLDGQVRLSCLTLAALCDRSSVTTVEGLQDGPRLTALQEAWVQHGASQCGFCTPGFLIVGTELLGRNPHPTEAEVRDAIGGNLCRCTGYVKIVEAILHAAEVAATP
jgi:aerobic-type carbon monoxide dehydrogenase small subunit (CoxS/CutS family)